MARFVINPTAKQKETGLGSAARNIYDVGAKIGGAVAGYPGDIIGGASGLINTGLRGLGVSEKVLPQAPNIGSEAVKENVTDPLKKLIFPQTHQEETNPVAETIGDVGAGITRALLPPFGAKSLSSVPAIIGRYLLGEAGAQGVKGLGGGVLAQEAGRLGTTFLGSLFGGKLQATTAMKDSYKQARDNVKGKTLYAPLAKSLRHKNTQFYDKLAKQITEEKDYLKKSSETIDKILSEAKPKVEELWDAKIGLNNKLKTFPRKSPEYRLGSQLVSSINETLEKYGQKNKDFGKNFQLGEELFKGLQASTEASKFLRENVNLKSIFRKPLYKLLLFSLSPGKIAAGAGSAVALREAAKFHDLLSQSPTARKMTADLLKGALQENSKAVIKNVLDLEKEFDKQKNISQGKRFVINRA